MNDTDDTVTVGGPFSGEVTWLDDHVAHVWCDGHARPLATYEAACHDGADLDDVVAVPARDASGPDNWYVGPKDCLRGLPQVWLEDLDVQDEEDDVQDEDDDTLDFGMLDLPACAGPCKAVRALECDPVEARLLRDVAAAPYRAAALRARGEKGAE